MIGIVLPLAYLVGMICVEAYNPTGRQRERNQHPETAGERYRRNTELIDRVRMSLVDEATENGRR